MFAMPSHPFQTIWCSRNIEYIAISAKMQAFLAHFPLILSYFCGCLAEQQRIINGKPHFSLYNPGLSGYNQKNDPFPFKHNFSAFGKNDSKTDNAEIQINAKCR
jgi:hypothetical protein